MFGVVHGLGHVRPDPGVLHVGQELDELLLVGVTHLHLQLLTVLGDTEPLPGSQTSKYQAESAEISIILQVQFWSEVKITNFNQFGMNLRDQVLHLYFWHNL